MSIACTIRQKLLEAAQFAPELAVIVVSATGASSRNLNNRRVLRHVPFGTVVANTHS